MLHAESSLVRCLLWTVILCLPLICFSQNADSTKQELNVKGNISVANNGISLIPTFTLGKPALASNINFSGKKRFSFEAELLYSIEDFRPWSIAFFWRYKIVRKEKFQLMAGTHLPVVNIVKATVIKDSVEQSIIQGRRFFPIFELVPNYQIAKNFRLELYLYFANGIDRDVDFRGYFFSLRPSFDKIPLTGKAFLRFYPQFYYLRIAEDNGIYAAATLALARQDFPLSLSSTLYLTLTSTLPAKDFDWNIALNYSFGKGYLEKYQTP